MFVSTRFCYVMSTFSYTFHCEPTPLYFAIFKNKGNKGYMSFLSAAQRLNFLYLMFKHTVKSLLICQIWMMPLIFPTRITGQNIIIHLIPIVKLCLVLSSSKNAYFPWKNIQYTLCDCTILSFNPMTILWGRINSHFILWICDLVNFSNLLKVTQLGYGGTDKEYLGLSVSKVYFLTANHFSKVWSLDFLWCFIKNNPERQFG